MVLHLLMKAMFFTGVQVCVNKKKRILNKERSAYAPIMRNKSLEVTFGKEKLYFVYFFIVALFLHKQKVPERLKWFSSKVEGKKVLL